MPILKFKQIQFFDSPGLIDYKEAINLAVKNPEPQQAPDGRTIPGSFDIDQLFYALKLMAKIAASNGEIDLTKEESAYLVGRVRKMSWLVADPAIGEFLTDVLQLENDATA